MVDFHFFGYCVWHIYYAALLQGWDKMFQAIFYNPVDQIQLPSNKLMDTVKIFWHLTQAVNGLLTACHATLGSTGVGFALLKNTSKIHVSYCSRLAFGK